MEELNMILFLEAIFIHGFLAFTVTFQSLFELNCLITLKGVEAAPVVEEHQVIDLPLWGLPRNEIIEQSVQVKPYEVSILNDEQLAFFESLSDNVGLSETVEEANEDDMLTMDVWQEEPEPVAVTSNLAAIANAKINDYQLGEQLWVVEVIGEEQGYLHVSDGSGRAWINSNTFGIFAKRDILSILVDRKSDLLVELRATEILQESSNEFNLADDLDSYYVSDSAETIGA